MPDHVPGWEHSAAYREFGLTQEQADAMAAAFARAAPRMPAHRIAYHLVTIQVSLLVIVGMVWAEVGGYGLRWLNLAIAVAAVYIGFAAHHRLWRGR